MIKTGFYKISRSVLTLVILVILLFTLDYFIFTAPVYPDDYYNDQTLEDIKKEKEETRKKIEEAQKEQEAYSTQVEEVEEKLLTSLSELNELNNSMAIAKSEIDKINLSVAANEMKIEEIEEQLLEKTELLNMRIAEIYKTNNRNFMDVILEAEDFIDFVTRFKLMNLLLKQDIELIQEIKDKKAELLNLNKKLLELRDEQESEKQQIEELVSLSEEKNREIEEIYNEKLDLFSQAKANKDALIAMENQLTAKEAEITNILQTYDYGVAPTGKLFWPTNGKISSGFGYRTSKTTGRTRFHQGIDIYAPLGAPVIAADSGQVLKAEYHGGYGLAILVYHGGGVATYYAHLSGINVNVGQYVQAGQIIGQVGNTGYTTGYHLHFEVRIKGDAKNPMEYL
jgi:murein DD-endopeptidase MepM/ murein hydrolase activator NlpD